MVPRDAQGPHHRHPSAEIIAIGVELPHDLDFGARGRIDEEPTQAEQGQGGKPQCPARLLDLLADQSPRTDSSRFLLIGHVRAMESIVQAPQVFRADREIVDGNRPEPAEQRHEFSPMFQEDRLAVPLSLGQFQLGRRNRRRALGIPDQDHAEADGGLSYPQYASAGLFA